MSQGSQVHIFLGAPVAPLKTTVSQGTASLMSTANAWEKVRLFYKQHSLYLKAGDQEFKNLEDCQVPKGLGPPGLLSGDVLTTSVRRSAQVDEDFKHSASEAQSVKSQVNLSDMTSGQMCGLGDGVQHLPEEEKDQKLQCKNKKITDEQSKNQSDPCVRNFQRDLFALDLKCAAKLDLGCCTEQMSTGTKPEPTGHRERQSQESFSDTRCEPQSEGAVSKASDQRLSAEAEFLSVLTSSQRAFLAQGNDKGQDCINKSTVNMEAEPTGSQGVSRTEGDFSKPGGDFEEESENEQSQVYSLELFSPVCPESESSHSHINPGKNLENTSSQELFSNEETLPPNELCSSHPSTANRSWCSKDDSHHSKALSEVHQVSKKPRMDSNIREAAKAVPQRVMSELKDSKKISLIKNCDSKNQKYNCLVMVLTPCHVKEITIKSGPNSGSKVPLATIVVIDQSEIKKRVVLWRTAAFGALTVFLGDIILLTDVVLYEDQWIGETVLQSTFTSQLLNLGSYSYVQPEKYSNVIANVILQDLLTYVSTKHSYLKDLPQRQPQKMNTVEFVELEQLQPDILVHAVLRVVDVTVLTGVVLIKAKVSELVFSAAAAQKIALNARSTLKSIFSSLPSIVYAGCAHCGSELETDENRIYRQCLSCLPFVGKKIFYRPALMTIVDGRYNTCVHVGSKMMEQILLNISPDCLNRVIVPSSEVTYGMVASDLLHSLLAVSAEPCVLKIQSFFELDENSYPLQQDFSLLDFCPDSRQKRTPDLITDDCEPPCGCWELNSGPLEKQPVLLTSEPSL